MARKDIAGLLKKLYGRSHLAREEAFEQLEQLSPLPGEYLPKLIEGLTSDKLGVRINCVMLIGSQGAAAAPAIPHLVAKLCDASEDRAPRSHAAVSLGWIGEAARPYLIELLRHPDPLVRLKVIDGLRISEAPEMILLLVGCLGDPVYEVRSHASHTLITAGEHGDRQAVMAALLEALQSEEKLVQAHAAYTIWHLDLRRPEPLPVVQALLEKEQDPDILIQCAEALESSRLWNVATVRLLARLLRHPTQRVRFYCLEALKKTKLARHVVADVVAVLRSKDAGVRADAAYVLQMLGPAASGAVNAVLRRLEKECHAEVQVALALAMAALEPQERRVRRRLAALLDGDMCRQAEELIRDTLSQCNDAE